MCIDISPSSTQKKLQVRLWWILTLSLSIYATVKKVSANNQEFLLSSCTCIGSSLIYECTAVGPGATIWKGSAFNCPETVNEVQLLHSQFRNQDRYTTMETCNNGQIVGYAVDVSEHLEFRSRLLVQVTSSAMNGTTVECYYDDGDEIHLLNSSKIILTTEPLPPPINIHLKNVSKGQIEFTWEPVTCTDIHYNIESVNCGRCPNTTSASNVTCTDVKITDRQTCIFGVSTVACSNLVGTNNTIEVQLEVPDISSSKIDVIPTYDNKDNHLKMLSTSFTKIRNTTFGISNTSISATSYTVNYTDYDTGKSCGDATISVQSCVNEACYHTFEIFSSACLQPVDINITIFATNVLGDGKTSNAIKRDYVNRFVDVDTISEENSIRCKFLSKSNEPNSSKLFQITFFDDNCQTKILKLEDNTTGESVSLSLGKISDKIGSYCFKSMASNDILTVNINGTYDVTEDITPSSTVNNIGLIIGILFLIITVTILLGILILFLVVHVRRPLTTEKQLRRCKSCKND